MRIAWMSIAVLPEILRSFTPYNMSLAAFKR
jgi:hypothetical protein